MDLSVIKSMAKKGAFLFKENLPVISIASGTVGLVGSTVMAVKATPKALSKVYASNIELEMDPYDVKEMVKTVGMKEFLGMTWKYYIPAAITGACGVGLIIFGTREQGVRAVALASAQGIAEKALAEYQDKVKELVGEEKADDIRSELNKAKLHETPLTEGTPVYHFGDGDHLVFESLSGRYFRGDVESIRKAMNDFNQDLVGGLYSTLNEWYLSLGLPQVKLGDYLGWSSSRLLDVKFDSQIADNGEPCIVINYYSLPGKIS